MTANEYILGLMAIVSGLAITEWVGSLYRLLAARRAVRWDWLATVAAGFSAFIILRSWWISWRSFGPESNPTLGLMTWNLTEIVLLFISARAALPETVPEPGVDLREHYARNSWLIWGGMTLSAGMLVGSNLVYDWRRVTVMWPVELVIVVGTLMSFSRRRWLHAIMVPLIVAFYVATTLGERMSGN